MIESELSHLVALIQVRIRDPDLVDEVLSEVVLAILKSTGRYDAQRPFRPWACGVALNVVAGRFRKEQRQPRLLDIDLSEMLIAEAEEEDALLAERKEHLRDCLPHLPPAERRLIRQKFYEKLTYPDLIQLSGRSQRNLYAVFSRAQWRLGNCIQSKLDQL